MFKKFLPVLPIILGVAYSAQAQVGTSPRSYDQYPGDERFGYGDRYEFDRRLLNAVEGCARRGAREDLRRVIIDEVARTRASRFQIVGRAIQAPYYGRGEDYPEFDRDRRHDVTFRCTADAWGRVLSWDVYGS